MSISRKEKEIIVFDWIKQLWMHDTKKKELFIPFALPVSMDKLNVREILNKSMGYVCSEKSDGFRCILLLGFYQDNASNSDVPFMATVDRKYKIQWHEVRHSDSDLFDGTILDCELMEDNSLIILDSIATKGYAYHKLNFNMRRESIETCLDEVQFLYPHKVFTKEWVPVNKIKTLKPRFKNDGFIFMATTLPIIPNRNTQMFKYKETHTIDFYIDENKNMYGSENGALVLFDNFVPIQDEDMQHKSGVYECKLESTSMNKFFFKRICMRIDKKTGNDINTINSTIKAISVNQISMEELMTLCTV